MCSDASIETINAKFKRFLKIEVSVDQANELEKILKQYDTDADNIRVIFKGVQREFQKIDKQRFYDLNVDVRFEDTTLQVEQDAIQDPHIFTNLTKGKLISLFLEYSKTKNFTNIQRTQALQYFK